MSKPFINPLFRGYYKCEENDPDERWYESHCPICKHNYEYEDGGKIYAECKNGCCEFEEIEDGND